LLSIFSEYFYALKERGRESMSMRDLLAGYAVTLALFVVGCLVIERSSSGLKGVRRLTVALIVAVAGLVLLIARPLAPPVFSLVLPHLAVFSALVLFHHAVNDVLELNQRYLAFSLALGLAACIGLLYYSAIRPDLDMRAYIIDSADAMQAGLTAYVLFRCRNAALRPAILATACLIATISLLHVLCLGLTGLRPPLSDLMQLDASQAFFVFFCFIFGTSAGLSLIWLSFCSQRNKLQALALTDGLTGLLNRRAFEETLQRELSFAQRHRMRAGLVLIDLDYFKSINDSHGHLVGDEVIRRVSASLHAVTRVSDALARFGGEELVLMLRDTDPFHASMVGERARQQVESLRGLPAGIHITASVGVAVSTPSDTIESLLKKTDDALYGSKRQGRNTVTCHRDPGGDSLPEAPPSTRLLPTRGY
jgi:diguanylate cyclase (GGDEF)-like protein